MNELYSNVGKIVCPRCEKAQDVLSYTRLENLNEKECVDIFKCKNCRFVFAPIKWWIADIINQ